MQKTSKKTWYRTWVHFPIRKTRKCENFCLPESWNKLMQLDRTLANQPNTRNTHNPKNFVQITQHVGAYPRPLTSLFLKYEKLVCRLYLKHTSTHLKGRTREHVCTYVVCTICLIQILWGMEAGTSRGRAMGTRPYLSQTCTREDTAKSRVFPIDPNARFWLPPPYWWSFPRQQRCSLTPLQWNWFPGNRRVRGVGDTKKGFPLVPSPLVWNFRSCQKRKPLGLGLGGLAQYGSIRCGCATETLRLERGRSFLGLQVPPPHLPSLSIKSRYIKGLWEGLIQCHTLEPNTLTTRFETDSYSGALYIKEVLQNLKDHIDP